MLEIVKLRHAWPEKEDFVINRPQGTAEYIFLHFWNSFEITINGVALTTKPHACILFEPGVPQHFTSKQASTQDWIHITGEVKETLDKYGVPLNTLFYPRNYDFITKIVRSIESEYHTRGIFSGDLMHVYLMELFIKLSQENLEIRASVNINGEIRDRLKMLRKRLGLEYDKHWDINKMSEVTNISPSHLHALYKRLYGISPLQDLITTRIQIAKTNLTETDLPISRIAEMIGYINTTHFTRQFTKIEGISPLKYRKHYKSGKN